MVSLLPILINLVQLAHAIAPRPPPAFLVELALIVEDCVVWQFPTVRAHRTSVVLFAVGLLL